MLALAVLLLVLPPSPRPARRRLRPSGRPPARSVRLPAGTVEDRLREYGPRVHRRLAPFFRQQRLAYPPRAAVLVGFKAERRLELYAAGPDGKFCFVRAYPILAASGRLGPKLAQGDRQVPEGVYPIESLNPNSRFHLSLRVGYPNAFDRRQAAREGRVDLGGDIMIHGAAVSAGCLAMGDRAAEDLFVLAAETGPSHLSVILSPLDFRRSGAAAPEAPRRKWVDSLYRTIRTELGKLPPPA